MDIRELRIGDKVTHLGRIVTIRAIYETGHVEFLMRNGTNGPLFELTINVKDINPIPLTDELLKKIGFECHYTVPIYEYGNCMYDLMFNSFHYLSCDKNNIKYLHQLQHELYDAGIEFKIEL